MRVRVKAPARLHFGFIDLDGTLGHIYGSVGLAIDQPRLLLEASAAHRLSVEGDEGGRAAALARHFLRHYRIREGAEISLKETIPPHAGLGSGTQLALGIATALARLFSVEGNIRELAAVMERGKRSGIGVGVFERGGFIVDGGRRVSTLSSMSDPGSIPPMIVRHPFPEDWTFVVATPHVGRGLAGDAETRAFRRLPARLAAGAGRLSRVLLMQMLPALVERDAVAFGRSLTTIQRIVGSWFRAVQGGAFARPEGAELARVMARAGALGVGQSSWGPTVYGMAADPERAHALEHQLRKAISAKIKATVWLTRASNRGADVVS